MTHSVRINDEQVTDRGTIDLDEQDLRLADGTRLTESRAQELTSEVLGRSGRGRPSLSRKGARSPQLRLSVPDELRSPLAPARRGRAPQRFQPGSRRPGTLPGVVGGLGLYPTQFFRSCPQPQGMQ